MLYNLAMPLFGQDRDKRNVRRNLEDNPSSGNLPNPDLSELDQEKPKKKHRFLKWFTTALLLLAVVAAILAALSYLYVKNTPLRGEASGRINILVMGVDDAASLSDTMMIVSIDTSDKKHYKTAFISLPRDLYLNIPGYGNSKINAAYSYGQAENPDGGGVALTKQTIEENFDLPIHYYASMDFTGFEKFIDTIGGVDVTIPYDLYDPEYPTPGYAGIQTFELAAGPHHLNGATALQVARCRKGTCGNDYGRADRQQQILVAAKSKVLTTNILLNKRKIDELRSILEQSVVTDITTREALKFAEIARNIPDQNITRHVIDTSNFLTSNGGSNLIPSAGLNDFSEINEFIANIFTQTGNNLPENQ